MFHHVFVSLTTITVIYSNSAVNAQQVIPFCSYCECTFESEDGVDLDCTNTDMKGILLDSYFWYDDYNASYRVSTLKARNSNLEALDEEFPSSTLKILDLSGNGISRIVDRAFSNLQNLVELDLSNNSLDYLKPDVFKGMYFMGQYYPLKTLKVLNLSSNKLKVLHQNLFEHISQVEELHVGYNPFAEINSSTQKALKTLTNLHHLNLSCCNLETLPDDLFSGRFKRLQSLDLSENLLLKVPKALLKPPALEVLNLNANPMLELVSSSVFSVPMKLKTLHLSYMPNLETIHAHALSGLKFLDELYLHDNAFLTRIHPRAFLNSTTEDELPQLRIFDMHNCNLSRLSVDLLPHWKTLDYLSISGNPWKCDCYNQIFIETVAVASVDEAKGVFCAANNKSFYQVKEEGLVLPCPLDESFSNFRLVFVLVLLINILAVFVCCLFKRRFKRVGKYVALRNV